MLKTAWSEASRTLKSLLFVILIVLGTAVPECRFSKMKLGPSR